MRRALATASVIVRLASRSAIGGGTRTVVLLAAMTVVIFVCVVLMSFLRGLEATVSEGVLAMHGHLRVVGLYKAEPGPGRPALLLPESWDAVRAELAAVDGVARISARTIHRVELLGPAGSLIVDLEGVDLVDEPLLQSVLAPAREAGNAEDRLSDDVLAAPRSVLLFAGQAERLGVKKGETLFIRTRTLEHRHTAGVFTVAEILGERGPLGEVRSFVERAALNELVGATADRASGWFISLRDPSDSKRAANAVHELLSRQAGATTLPRSGDSLDARRGSMSTQGALGTTLHLSEWTEELEGMRWLLSVFTLLGNLALFLMLVVLAIGVTNISFVAVQDRRAELGTLRAMGMGRAAVGSTVVAEMAGLALLATAVGSSLGLGFAHLISSARIRVGYEGLQTVLWSDTLNLQGQPAAALMAGIVLVTVSAASSLLPAVLAARLPPVESMERSR